MPIKPHNFIYMDGDRYKLTLPRLKDAITLRDAAERCALFLDEPQTVPYLCQMSTSNAYIMAPIDLSMPDAKSHAFIHLNGADDGIYETDSTLYKIRPMLIPVDENGEFNQDIIEDDDGTFVYGGSLYNSIGPIPHALYGVHSLAGGITIGDTADCRNEEYFIPWLVYEGKLISRRILFTATGEQLWYNGIR